MIAVPGFNFIDGDLIALCSDGNLETFMTSATFSGMEIADFLSTELPAHIGDSPPSNLEVGQPWFRPQANGNASNPAGVYLVYNGSVFVPVAEGMIATSQEAMVYGDIVYFLGSPSIANYVRKWTTAGDSIYRNIGICAGTIEAGGSGPIITFGMAIVNNLDASGVVWGAVKGSSTTNNSVVATSTAVTTGCFARLLDTTKKIVFVTGQLKAA